MRTSRLLIAGIIIVVVMMVAFIVIQPPTANAPDVEPTANGSDMAVQIASERDLWEAANVGNYTIRVRVADLPFSDITHIVTVRDGEVSDYQVQCDIIAQPSACTPDPARAADYSVEGLFAIAEARAAAATGSRQVAIEFDPTYHYPARISTSIPDAVDSATLWQVVRFDLSG